MRPEEVRRKISEGNCERCRERPKHSSHLHCRYCLECAGLSNCEREQRGAAPNRIQIAGRVTREVLAKRRAQESAEKTERQRQQRRIEEDGDFAQRFFTGNRVIYKVWKMASDALERVA